MKLAFDIPDLKEYPNGFPNFWLDLLFNDSPWPYHVHAILATYVRVVEAAFHQYRGGVVNVHAFWNHHGSLNMQALHASSAELEACFSHMHMAVKCISSLRGKKNVPQQAKDLVPEKPEFLKKNVAATIRLVRNKLQHVEELVFDGTIPDKSPFMILPGGPEKDIPGEPGQTLKTIDRLRIADLEVRFSDIHCWLVGMGQCAEKMTPVMPKMP